MSVKVMFIGRLGNNLFQYAIGRIIAQRHGWALNCRRYPAANLIEFGGLDQGTPGANLIATSPYFADAPLQIPGQAFSAPTQNFQLDVDGWKGQEIDLDAILADPTPREIRLAGYFQRYAYYRPHADTIRRWFQAGPIEDGPRIGPRDVLINVRRGADFDKLGWRIEDAYYRQVISGLPDIGQVYVCGTGLDEAFRASLADLDPIFYESGPLDQLRFIASFRRMIISNSTFSWWGAYLSEADAIFTPDLPKDAGYGFESDGIDLRVDEDRYHWVPAKFAPAVTPISA